jgi:glycopeptide antibiotics resistance protein
MFHKNRHFLPAYIFGVLILIGASMPTAGLRKIRRINDIFGIIFSDYSLHFFGFGVFAALLAWGYYKKKSSAVLIRSGLLAFSFGLFIEVYQLFLPYRSFSIIDLAVDSAGIVFMLGLFWGIVIKR